MTAIPEDDIRTLLDLIIGSLDFGSGFLCDEDVIALRRVARALGMDPDKATPHEWRTFLPTGERKYGAVQVESDHLCSEPRRLGQGLESHCLCGYVGRESGRRKLRALMVAHAQEMLEKARDGSESS